MDLRERLARRLLEDHPEEAAAALERLAPGDAAAVLRRAGAKTAATVLRRAAPHRAAAALAQLGVEEGAQVLGEMPLEDAARLLRVCEPPRARLLLEARPEREASLLRALLSFPEDTAGALMDPEVLGIPADLTAREALALVRESPERARYNLYAIDRDHQLVGVLNIRELLLAVPGARIEGIMRREVLRLRADADRRAIVDHPGWREVHSLPVVDGEGAYLGAIRYRTLRRLERELAGVAEDGGTTTAGALGELFATAAAGVLEALIGAPSGPAGRRDGRKDHVG